jgi:hypothetical protein
MCGFTDLAMTLQTLLTSDRGKTVAERGVFVGRVFTSVERRSCGRVGYYRPRAAVVGPLNGTSSAGDGEALSRAEAWPSTVAA